MFFYTFHTIIRNQKASTLQKDCGIFLQNHGMLLHDMGVGRFMGFAPSRNSVQCKMKKLAERNTMHFAEQIKSAYVKHKIAAVRIDDFHNIMTIKGPTTEMLSRADHFAGCLYRMAEVLIDDFHNIMTIK